MNTSASLLEAIARIKRHEGSPSTWHCSLFHPDSGLRFAPFLTRIFHIQGYLFFLTFLIMPEFSYLVSPGPSSYFAD
jgi:hypothetical protein